MSTIAATSNTDSGAGSLRAPIAQAGDGDSIDIDVNPIQLDSTLTIDGNAPSGLVDIHEGSGTGSAVVVQADATVAVEAETETHNVF